LFFCNGQHNFLGGERKGGKNSWRELLLGLPRHTRIAIMPGVAGHIECHPVRRRLVLFWGGTRYPNGVGACSTHVIRF